MRCRATRSRAVRRVFCGAALAMLVATVSIRARAGDAPEPVKLQTSAMAAFEKYVRLTGARNAEEISRRSPFLRADALPEEKRAEAYAAMQRGEVEVEKLQTLDGGKPILCPGCLIHDWAGTVFIPGATLTQTLAMVEDYNRHSQIYAPYELKSQILARDGGDFKVRVRFLRKKVITVVLDVVFNIDYHTLDATHAWSHAHTESVRQIEDHDTPEEYALPEGDDGGYLWAMETYWRFVERDGGTYVQCESASLTRSVPAIFAWIVDPFLRSIPRESLTGILSDTRKGVLHPPTGK